MKSKGDYAIAIQVLLSCARQPGVRLRSADLAGSVGVNASRIRTIVAKLARAGMLDAAEGRAGGITLGRVPTRIELEEVRRVVDPSPFVKIRETPPGSKCPVGCKMGEVMAAIEARIESAARRALRGMRLADLLEIAEG